jgi:2-dehydropantoate 2-reductase
MSRGPDGSAPETRSPLVVWGAGAIGGSIGAELVRQGRDVLFVDQDRDHVDAMNRRGLEITGPVSEFRVPVTAVQPADVRGRHALVLLCVKAHHTGAAAAQLEPHLSPGGAVVSIQNGLCELELARVVGRERVVGAFVNFGADYLRPGTIHRGNRGAVVVGELDGATTSRIRKLHRTMRLFEPDAVLTDNIFGYLWGKLAYAALLFATALTDDSIADVLESSRDRPLLRSLAREVLDVAAAQEVRPEPFDGFDPVAFSAAASEGATDRSLDELVLFNRASAKTHSGIWRDLAVRRRPTEVDAQLGVVSELGRTCGVPTPLLNELVEQIHQIEAGTRSSSRENLRELAESMPVPDTTGSREDRS